jgi:hypothetical protein
MSIRGHQPIVFDQFKGLWDRGDAENTPLDHFQDCDNLISLGNNITVRPGIGLHQSVAVPLEDVRRKYNYPTPTGNTLIVLVINSITGDGEIYHVVDSTTVFGPILTIAGMTDFAFVPYAGRGYISPFSSFVTGDLNIEKGLENETLYVYMGDGTPARAAAGSTPAGTLTIANGAAGNTDAGLHVFAVVGESDSGFLSEPFAFASFTTVANQSVSFGTVPVLVGAQWVKRHIVATHVIPSFNGDLQGYQFFFIPDGEIPNNTDLFLNDVSFFDAALVDDASYLIDNFATIPAGACLWMYHDRLCLATTFNDISLIYISAPGEPEAISEIDGLIIVPLDGNPITNGGELRDIMYVFKRAKTTSYTDTGEEPSSWPDSPIDASIGTCVHGIASVLDSGNASVDYFIICTYAGVLLFNGRYILPELSFKVQQRWKDLDRNEFRKIQIVNAPVQKWILIVLPDGRILVGDYNNGLDPKNIRWWPWTFNVPVNCIEIVNIDQIIIGSPIYEGPF